MFTQPVTNLASISAITSGFFLPMALRRRSASARVNPANRWAMSIT